MTADQKPRTQGLGLYIHGKRDTRFDGKCSVCGELTLDATGVSHKHFGEPGSAYDQAGYQHPIPPRMLYPPNEFLCPFCDGRIDFNAGHGKPTCARYKSVDLAIDAWADKLDDRVVARRRAADVVVPKKTQTR
jgi:hypothetical protein